MNRNRLIVGLVILVVLMILMISGSVILLREWNDGPAKVGQRVPISSLRYCSSNQVRPCVLSFNLDSDENMLINMLIDRSSPGFYIKIKYGLGENIYPCRKSQGSSTSVSCVGAAMPPGEILQFLMISRKEGIPLAEGHFPIIGLALATPEVAPSPTSETPFTSLPTDDFFTMTPAPIEASPVSSPPPSSTAGFFTATPTLVDGPSGASSPPPFSTPIGTPTDGPPPSTGGPPSS